MKRIMIIGCCGAGKSTLAKKVQCITNLELVHLDKVYWLPNWVEPAKDVWMKKVGKIAARDSWIIDGNYSGTMDVRLKRADMIVYLDQPTLICLYRVIKRSILHYGKTREDMAEGCNERFSWSFWHYVLIFNMVKRPKLLKRIARYNQNKQVVILRNRKEITDFYAMLV